MEATTITNKPSLSFIGAIGAFVDCSESSVVESAHISWSDGSVLMCLKSGGQYVYVTEGVSATMTALWEAQGSAGRFLNNLKAKATRCIKM